MNASTPIPAARAATRLPWPLPALLAWALAWAVFVPASRAGLGATAAWLPAALLPAALALVLRIDGRWRQAIVVAGFPLSSLASGVALPPWAWGVAALALLLVYPLKAWRDAPIFPTPPQALRELGVALPLPAGSRVLDAGCGLGHGLRALHAAWPSARIEGIEWSWPMALWCLLRCRFAAVRRGDLWRGDWSPYTVVYLFQRPESMARAWAKARAEMPAGSWLVSLEFPVPGVEPRRRLDAGHGRPLWLYRMPGPSIRGRRGR